MIRVMPISLLSVSAASGQLFLAQVERFPLAEFQVMCLAIILLSAHLRAEDANKKFGMLSGI